jgi:hypothetical protein
MAKEKKEKSKKAPAEMRLRVRKHIDSLGFTSVSGYLQWCIDNGFKASLDKDALELDLEKSAQGRNREHRQFLANIDGNPTRLIKEACALSYNQKVWK